VTPPPGAHASLANDLRFHRAEDREQEFLETRFSYVDEHLTNTHQ
jgi:hypothetical protein